MARIRVTEASGAGAPLPQPLNLNVGWIFAATGSSPRRIPCNAIESADLRRRLGYRPNVDLRLRNCARVAACVVGAMAASSLPGCGALLGVDFDDAHPTRAADAEIPDTADAGPRAPTFCETLAPAPFFCADFEGEDLHAGWGAPGLTPDLTDTAGAKSERVEVDSDSPPELGRYVARFSAPALLTKEKLATAFLYKQLPRVLDLAINFKMRIVSEQFEPGGRVELFEISSGDDFLKQGRNIEGTLLVTRTAGGVTQADIFRGGVGGSWLTHDAFQPLPVNAWRNVQVVMEHAASRDGGTTEIIVRVDNEIQADRALGDDLFMSNPIAFLMGIAAITGPSDVFRAEFDNVRIDLTPAN
jgi:hypothetical protein